MKSTTRRTNKQTGRIVAIKQLPLGRSKDEMVMMKTSAHPNVTEYFESFDFGRCIWIVMEFMDGRSLAHLVEAFQRKKKTVIEPVLAGVVKQVLTDLEFLHEKGRTKLAQELLLHPFFRWASV